MKKSRIEKGLLAIPVSLVHLFPQTSGHIFLLDEGGRSIRRSFTAYDSSSKECRIGGMREHVVEVIGNTDATLR